MVHVCVYFYSIAPTIIVGGIAGKCENTTLEMDNNMTISAFISTGVQGRSGGAGQGIAGGVIGQFLSSGQEGSSSDNYSLIDNVTVNGNVENAKYVGGIIGEVNGHNIRIGSDSGTSVVSVNTAIWGQWTESGSAVGGIIGAAKGQYIEVYHAQVGGSFTVSPSIGGIFGDVGDGNIRSVVKVKDVTVTATVDIGNSNRVQGGIFGTVYPNSMAALDGSIDISGLSESGNRSSAYKGHIAGKQTEALIYFETEDAYNNCKRPTGRTWVDDIGSYGGVYLNSTWGEDDSLISYTQKKVTGAVINSGKWEIDSEADMIRLAIALNTQGKFEDGCFDGAGKESLLSAEYQLEDKTFDLSKSGIYSLNRNDGAGYNEKFTGKMTGNSNTKIQLGDCTTYQSYVALFPHVGDGAEFSNFTLEGKQGASRGIAYAKNGAAGLAVYGEGNVTVENVSVNAAITGNTGDASYKYGGMFATFTANTGTTLSVKNSKLSGSININQSATNNNNKHYAGGLIADYVSNAAENTIEIEGLELNQRIESNSRFTSGMITQMNGSNTNADKTILKMSDITIKNGSELKITDKMDAGEDKADVAIGGFLGREWFDVKPYETDHYSIKNLAVGENGAENSPVYEANAGFGAMIHTVTGRIQLVDTKVNKIKITGNNTSNDGLLINRGYDALIEIDGYSVDRPGVTIAKAENFSEIVGRNISDTDNYTSGGIVNIISSDFKADSMEVYENQGQSDDVKSGSVRYYYNLFGNTLAGESTFLQGNGLNSNNLIIDSADKMMIWHLSQYMNDSIRARYLTPYFTNGTLPTKNTGTVTVSGKIDINGKSYYPTPVTGMIINGAGAEIDFCADKILGVGGKKPSEVGEHYLMHSGLLLSAEGDVTVQGEQDNCLTLTGTVSNAGNKSGALFSGEIAGNKNIYWLKLKDLYIADYSSDHAHGLMIGKVKDDSTLDISWIETDYASTDKKAASALIGTVGEPDRIIDNVTVSGSRNIVIDFTNMKVDAAKTGIFENAAFIDQYYYTDDTEKNRGRIWYLFTEEAAKGGTGGEYAPFDDDTHGHNSYSSAYITLGNELKYGVEYWNRENDVNDELINGGDWENYLPYVCMNSQHPESKQIRVNPKNAAITQGCGVYEDPYIISTPKQLLALACYLTDPKDKYLENWEINQIGNDENFCQETSHIAVTWRLNDQGEVVDGFPTQDQLRNAYYLIDADIDLSNLTFTTDRDIAQKFAGLGTSEKPFTGVIIGRKSNNSIPEITLPNKNKNNLVANFGLIQYAKGAVVKDLKISCKAPDSSDDRNNNLTNVVRISGTSGAAIACVLGGDNIIDNVTVSNQIAAANQFAVIGGYVGTVQQGSVILRNMPQQGFSEFKCGTYNTTDHTLKEFATSDLGDYPYVSGVIGKVENGFVVYERIVDAGTLVLAHDATAISGVYSHSVLPLSKTYDIVTAQGLSEAKNSPMNIEPTTDGFECEIKTAAQLQIVSMAINSDAFSVYYDGRGYDRNAVCRKAEYSYVGRDDCTEYTSDYENAIGKDNPVYWYPYIYNYFTFDGISAADSDKSTLSGFYKTLEPYTSSNGESGYRSKLNAVTSDVTSVMSYSLVDGSNTDINAADYDLSVYGRAFRGLGAVYRVFENDNATADLTVGTGVYSDFRANFNGANATVKAEMSNEYDRAIHTTALFNDLVNVDAQNAYTIENLVITGEFSNYDASDSNSENYAGNRAAAAVGMMRRPWMINNVIASDVTVESNGHAAGIAAWINPGEESADLIDTGKVEYTLKGCIVQGKSSIKTGGGSCGGILGVMTPANKDTIADDTYSLSLTDCKVLGTENNRLNITNEGKGILNTAANPDFNSQDGERKGRGRTGALIGYVGKRTYKLDNAGDISYIDPEKRVTIQLTIKDTATTESDPTVRYTTVDGIDSTGGIIGEYCGIRANASDTTTQNIKIDSVIVSDSLITSKDKNESKWYSFGVGGIIGEIGARSNCTINSAKVLNSDIKSALYNNNSYGLHAGGIVGSIFYYSNVILDEVEVRGELDADGYPVYEISSSDDLKGSENEILINASGDAGGLVGRCKGAGAYSASTNYIDWDKTTVKITSGEVSGMEIVSDNRSDAHKNKDKDVSSGTSTGGVGGMIGEVYKATATVNSDSGNNCVENCVIRTGYNSSTGVGAGGVIGEVWFAGVYDIKNVNVTKCKIGSNGSLKNTNKLYAGGIIGYYHLGSSNNDIYRYTSGTLQGVSVTECDMFGVYTGGLFGYAASHTKIGNVWENTSDNISVSDNKLLGSSYVGGAIGKIDNYSGVITYFEKVTIRDNMLLALNVDTAYAGGFCGGQTLADNSVPNNNSHYNQISILNNYIMSCNANDTNSNYAGGMFGILRNSGAKQYNLYAYETELKDNHIGYYNFADANPGKNVSGYLGDDLEGQLAAITTLLESLGKPGSNTMPMLIDIDGNPVSSLSNPLGEDELYRYSKCFGNLVGTYSGTLHAYFLKPTVTYTDAYTGVRPVMDAGGSAEASSDYSLLDSPYAYRKNIHVIYYEPDTTASNTAVTEWGTSEADKNRLFNQINAEGIMEEYINANNTNNTEDILDAYRLNVKSTNGDLVKDVYSYVYKNDKGYLSPLKNANGNLLPMIVLDAQYGDADELLGPVFAILTGSGGVYNSGKGDDGSVSPEYDAGLYNITKITATAMEVENGVISPSQEDSSLEVSNSSGQGWTIAYTGQFDKG